jgi:hypothetical protein
MVASAHAEWDPTIVDSGDSVNEWLNHVCARRRRESSAVGESAVQAKDEVKPMILETIELQVETLLKKLNMKSLPVAVEDIAGKLQIRISRAPTSDFSGMLLRKGVSALIGVNSNHVAQSRSV